ncbi:hypothetical protein MuYL_1382 [Mucilaginibacter xinganensis]|uniref:Uncharacterized protein n=1 Tax=Mucilaginibacter xinganensis TaxID=1234841 RepID=A0A223NU41_9SPHI|nr:hypothetical protein MuYL_1382 [Mucilaginibacter xinganensis]
MVRENTYRYRGIGCKSQSFILKSKSVVGLLKITLLGNKSV